MRIMLSSLKLSESCFELRNAFLTVSMVSVEICGTKLELLRVAGSSGWPVVASFCRSGFFFSETMTLGSMSFHSFFFDSCFGRSSSLFMFCGSTGCGSEPSNIFEPSTPASFGMLSNLTASFFSTA